MNDLTRQILRSRGARNLMDVWRPWAFLTEPEYSRFGFVEDVATIFLTNRECPFHCLMCDLWKNTTTETVPVGSLPAQMDYALNRLGPARHLKLYNSGNFFDQAAIPRSEWPAIAERSRPFETVIVENHPRLCSDACSEFQSLLGTQLEVALGLETSHEETLAGLNKQMTLADFNRACEILRTNSILIRVFILLKPPRTTESQGIERALRSIQYAFDCGASCCSVIPVRGGNGMMEQLQEAALFEPPRLSSLESVLSEALSWRRGRVFADLWDARQFADNPDTADEQIQRLRAMNLTQRPFSGKLSDSES